ncbi:MAG TPA: hypothetical protein VLE99_02150 [Candidatus Saccharimonadales bacterium]|nr:hypothetical protein [Candidatus Saccharimonadales bacterium]
MLLQTPHIHQPADETSGDIRAFLRQWHEGDEVANGANYGPQDAAMDELVFGRSLVGLEKALSTGEQAQIRSRHPGELVYVDGETCNWTPYGVLRSIVRHLHPSAKDVVYDLGAGFGTLPIYAGATTDAVAIGIELVHHRVEVARSAIGRLGLGNVEMREGSVLDHDFSDGTVFYMFAPFSPATRNAVMARIGEIAREQRVKVVMRRMTGGWMEGTWLADAKQTEVPGAGVHTVIIEAGPS